MKLLVLILVAGLTACTSAPAERGWFGAWGSPRSASATELSALTATIAFMASRCPNGCVLARYTGSPACPTDTDRLDLASLPPSSSFHLDLAALLPQIESRQPSSRARQFRTAFPSSEAILELSAPQATPGGLVVTACVWYALTWRCELPGTCVDVSLKEAEAQWVVQGATGPAPFILGPTDCP